MLIFKLPQFNSNLSVSLELLWSLSFNSSTFRIHNQNLRWKPFLKADSVSRPTSLVAYSMSQVTALLTGLSATRCKRRPSLTWTADGRSVVGASRRCGSWCYAGRTAKSVASLGVASAGGRTSAERSAPEHQKKRSLCWFIKIIAHFFSFPTSL